MYMPVKKLYSLRQAFGLLSVSLLMLILAIAFSEPVTAQKQSGKGKKKPTKQICITFDELPVSAGFGEVDIEAVTYLVLETLKSHKVKAAGFVVGERIETSFDVLGQWLNEGHRLGSMTYSNQDLHGIGIQQFIGQIQKGTSALEPMLSGFGQKKRYFRYPYLHHGENINTKKQVRLYLDDHNIIVCPATVVPDDYLYNLTLEKMGKQPDSAAYDNLLNEYINHVLDELERAEEFAKKLEGRPVKHILLLRASRLNAVYLDEMLTALEDMGYGFVTLDSALKDKLYSRSEAYFGPHRLGLLDMLYQSDPNLLPAE
jgi:peptidoglycan/xylan/chitin deacetylase (PgdA/CDA1 family)